MSEVIRSKYLIFVVVLLLFFGLTAASEVTRSFSSTPIDAGGSVSVTLNVTITGGETFYAIEENTPLGWVWTDHGGGNTTDPNILRWAVIQDAVDTTYTYVVQAPTTPGDYYFDGIYLFENVTGPLGPPNITGGETTMTVKQCTLTDAYWDQTSVTDGTLVNLIVEGTNCDGLAIDFTIYENDPVFDDTIKLITATYDSTTWTSVWTYVADQYAPGYPEDDDDDWGTTDARDYYFVATLVSNPSESINSYSDAGNPLLEVNIPDSCDADSDTYYADNSTCGGSDCDDNDPNEFPGQTWYKDLDGDLYSDGTTSIQCERPVNYKVASELTQTSGDCNDNDPNINPGATEVCDDSVDNDCDGTCDTSSSTCTDGSTPGDSDCGFDYDINNDGNVNIGDVSMVAIAFGSTCTGPDWCGGRDVNHNRVINIQDLSLIGMNFT